MKKIVWTFGLIAGGILSVLLLASVPLEQRIGYDGAEVLGYATMVAAFLLIFFGVRAYRESLPGFQIGFGRALATGALIAVTASVCYTATWEVIFFGLRPDFGARMKAVQIEQVRKRGGTPAEIDRKLADLERFSQLYRNPAINAAITFIEPLPVGLGIALVTAAALSRRRRSGIVMPAAG